MGRHERLPVLAGEHLQAWRSGSAQHCCEGRVSPHQADHTQSGQDLLQTLRKTECGQDFTDLAELGLVSNQLQRQRMFPLHLQEALMRHEVMEVQPEGSQDLHDGGGGEVNWAWVFISVEDRFCSNAVKHLQPTPAVPDRSSLYTGHGTWIMTTACTGLPGILFYSR